MDDRDLIRLKILDEADGGEFLFHLLTGVVLHDNRGRKRELYGATDRDETRDVLVELLRRGLVEVYRLRAAPEEDEAVDAETALRIIQDDANWEWPEQSGRPVSYEVVLTDAGHAAYFVAHERVVAAAPEWDYCPEGGNSRISGHRGAAAFLGFAAILALVGFWLLRGSGTARARASA